MTGSDWIALVAVIAGAVTAIFSLTGQHRTNLAMYRFEERWRAYIDYIAWYEEHHSMTDQAEPPAELKSRLMAWGSAHVHKPTAEAWTVATAAKLNKQIREEFRTRRRPQAFLGFMKK